MLAVSNKKEHDKYDIEYFLTDGQLTELSDCTKYDYRKLIDEMHRLGRPLTELEAEKYKIDK